MSLFSSYWRDQEHLDDQDNEDREIEAAFEAGFRAGQICGNGLDIAYKEWKEHE